ncbi:MAG: hypothetical protein ABWY92_21660, partial [Xanthobacteraceae bacterium]
MDERSAAAPAKIWDPGHEKAGKSLTRERTEVVARAVDETRFPLARSMRETELGYLAIINLILKDRRPRAGPFCYWFFCGLNRGGLR